MRHCIILMLLPGLMATWARASDGTAPQYPSLSRRYSARLVESNLKARVGEAITLEFTLDPEQPPKGVTFSVNMKLQRAPELARDQKPDILTGFPKTRAVFRTPGTYTYAVVVSLITKSSCGGVEAEPIFDGEARIEVEP